MTQTTAAAAPQLAGAPAAAGALTAGVAPSTVVAPGPARAGRLRGTLSRTPGQLRLAAAGAVLACLLIGALGLRAGLAQAQALADAAADTAQLVGIQQVRNSLVVADATATNAFLVGGLEPAQQRERYDAAVASAAARLAALSGSNAADAELLGEVTADLTVYTGLVEQARANNRQGFPVGAAYLAQASSVLRDDILPALDTLVGQNSDRVETSFDAVRGALWFLALGLVAFAVLVGVQVWLARRTHRRLNAGLLSASVVVLVAGVVGAWMLWDSSGRADEVRSGPHTATVAVSAAYSLANDAKSMESFTLIQRGSGQAYEEAFVAGVEEALGHLDAAGSTVDPALAGLLQDWIDAHAQIRALDDGGDWDAAVALAVSDADDAPNAVFDAFSAAADESLAGSAAETDRALSGSGGVAIVVGWVLLGAGVLGAVLGWRGVNTRLEEYR